MTRPPSLRHSFNAAFSLVESLAMLITLAVFSMIVASLWIRYQKNPDSMPRLSTLRDSQTGDFKPPAAPQSPAKLPGSTEQP
jgi:hypothetical protein